MCYESKPAIFHFTMLYIGIEFRYIRDSVKFQNRVNFFCKNFGFLRGGVNLYPKYDRAKKMPSKSRAVSTESQTAHIILWYEKNMEFSFRIFASLKIRLYICSVLVK